MLREIGGKYCSYATHNWCKQCDRWRPKIGNYCTLCGGVTRKRPRTKTKKFKESQWVKAY